MLSIFYQMPASAAHRAGIRAFGRDKLEHGFRIIIIMRNRALIAWWVMEHAEGAVELVKMDRLLLLHNGYNECNDTDNHTGVSKKLEEQSFFSIRDIDEENIFSRNANIIHSPCMLYRVVNSGELNELRRREPVSESLRG